MKKTFEIHRYNENISESAFNSKIATAESIEDFRYSIINAILDENYKNTPKHETIGSYDTLEEAEEAFTGCRTHIDSKAVGCPAHREAHYYEIVECSIEGTDCVKSSDISEEAAYLFQKLTAQYDPDELAEEISWVERQYNVTLKNVDRLLNWYNSIALRSLEIEDISDFLEELIADHGRTGFDSYELSSKYTISGNPECFSYNYTVSFDEETEEVDSEEYEF